MTNPRILWCLLFINFFNSVRSEFFTALVELEKTLHTEKLIAADLKEYIKFEEEKINKLKSIAQDYENHSAVALGDLDHHLGNPVNSYLIIKRFTLDWQKVEELVKSSNAEDFLANISQRRVNFPTEEDLNGAAAALLRLQDTYQLPTEKIASGDLQGVQIHTELSADECFELGRYAYTQRDFYHTVLWMQEAYNKYDNDANHTVDKSDIVDHLAYATALQGNLRQAIVLTDELLTLVPTHERAAQNKKYYEKVLAEKREQEGQKKKGDDQSVPVEETVQLKRQLDEYRQGEEFTTYEALCRGEDVIPNPYQHQLKCRYYTNDDPLLLLSPIKEEEIYFMPRIVMLHDVVYDGEIEKIKEMASPRLARATIQNPTTGKLEFAQYRISKSAWLKTEEADWLKRLQNRVGAFTHLNMNTAEDLQVVNYGIGGHYEPHFDFARKEEVNAFKSLGTGNRIATVLFYMSDVGAGGATVFPRIGVKVFPKKGAAAFWYNLYQNGEGDYDTRHAACPVLTGSKWVSNRWIHERGQEFHRPCALDKHM